MATQQAYHAYSQNKGTLASGQTITVNKYDVQVERYLSQGGFAHVYLVRTARPVYNTTHHVLKRIAVANEAMLKDVKKEVDVMRLLKGHPNIVHLIDAAWHKLSNGTFEVFILMEFCPGGGIIDMMNRRLRERLTEAEILQIFVDVCEGVACMHNLRPALLHRDLKVENILQSSSTSYKLCDFGSATTVSRPPTTVEEIRALEADLNRHTTLQYRAPEMVDLFSRRPVDEKSDVWALGVLLYKLCYYTTPFEEHGQLAILNVQYRVPPYPVYSLQMNQLIASMLQEHGMRRPSVFEVLLHVHRLRGTKSRFQYVIPVPQPLSLRQQTYFQSSSPSQPEHMSAPLQYKVPMSVSPSKSPGIQAREKVMEAIAPLTAREQAHSQERKGSGYQIAPNPHVVQPMRRGRPSTKEPATHNSEPGSGSSSEELGARNLKPGKVDDWLDTGFALEGDNSESLLDGWNSQAFESNPNDRKDAETGFADDFGAKLWNSVGVDKTHMKAPAAISRKSSPGRPSPSPGLRLPPGKDAFHGLGLGFSAEQPAPTLAEARKLRTGLAVMQRSGLRTTADRSGGAAPRPTPSPRQTTPSLYSSSISSLSPNLQGMALRPAQPSDSKRTSPSPLEGISPETRFPSLEELDASFSPSLPSAPISSSPRPDKATALTRYNTNSDSGLLKPELYARGYHARKGTKSEQVTGIAMQNLSEASSNVNGNTSGSRSSSAKESISKKPQPTHETKTPPEPSLPRKYHDSVSIKQTNSPSSTGAFSTLTSSRATAPVKAKDWLTGDDESYSGPSTSYHSVVSDETPVLRDSPSKRASLIQSNTVAIQDGVFAQQDHAPYLAEASAHLPLSSEVQISPTLSRFARSFPPIDTEDSEVQPVRPSVAKSLGLVQVQSTESASSGDEGPEEAAGNLRSATRSPKRKGHKGRQSSVHELVDLYGGGLSIKEKEQNTTRTILQPMTQDSKARSRPAPLGVAKLSLSPSPSSPNLLLTSPSIKSSGGLLGGNEQPSLAIPRSPVKPSSRSRPQSLIIFPSKSNGSHSTAQTGPPSLSPGLVPPEDIKHTKAARRTSISDMVQLYEDMNGGNKFAGPSNPLSPIASRPIGAAKVSSTDVRPPRSTAENEKTSTPLPSDVRSDGDKLPRSSTEQKPALSAPTIKKPIPLRNITIRQEPTTLPHSLVPDSSRPTRPTKIADNLENDSSSPERPYQGVGKLIDQWQRKTAEAAESQKPNHWRGPFVAKRGLTQDSSK